ncbi:MAG: MBL fold metallo-hydrolase [Ruminococcaceae bacterium]|nr:MBL fold metallo-hydrolase [Oscillospiraceae bacterium]
MKLRYLGTAAAEGIPGLFCNCKVCQNALKVRGKEIKTRSQALVDDRILIDFPPDTYMHVLNYGLDLREINHCIITHSHFDHLFVNDFWCRLEGIAHGVSEEPMHIFLTESGYRKAEQEYGANVDGARLKFHKIRPFEPFMIEDYRITPIAANHDKKADPVIFAIERGGKAMLYANDTGILPDESWEYLKKMDVTFDFVSLDCTGMLLTGWRNGHMDLGTNKEFFEKLCQMGRCDGKTVVYVNHFSHNGLATHEQLVVEAAKYGFGVSFDGLEVEI